MELNRTQLLVHDNEALAKLCRDHIILDDVLIERPGPNEEANIVEREGNHILVKRARASFKSSLTMLSCLNRS